MALHNISKGDINRDSPHPNTHDEQGILPMAHGTNSVNYVTDASPSSQANLLGGNAQLIAQGTATVAAPDGSSGLITTTTTTVAHGLSYTPMALAYMNNVIGSGYGIPLPLWVSFGNNTGGTGGASEFLAVIRYMTYAVDGTNLYILTYSSGVAVATNYEITYYLYRQRAQ